MAFVGADAQANNNSATVTVTIPAGASVGDVAWLAWTSSDTIAQLAPAGWVVLWHGYNGNQEYGIYRRVLQAGDPGSSLVLSDDGSVNKQTATIIVWDGVDTTAPEGAETTAPNAVNLTSATRSLTPATLTAARDVITGVMSRGSVTLSSWAPPDGCTLAAQAFNAGGGETSAAVAYGTFAAGTVSGDWVSNAADARGVTYFIVIEPAGGGGWTAPTGWTEVFVEESNGTTWGLLVFEESNGTTWDTLHLIEAG